MSVKGAALGRTGTGLVDAMGTDVYEKLKDKKLKARDKEGLQKLQETQDLAKEFAAEQTELFALEGQPFVGAQPKLLKRPEIASQAEAARATQVASSTIAAKIHTAAGVHVVCAEDSRYRGAVRELLEGASDAASDVKSAPVVVSMSNDWLQTLPHTERPELPKMGDRLLVYLGTPGKYLSMCIRSDRGAFEAAYAANRLVILCRGVCMLPLGLQEQNIFGVESEQVIQAIVTALRAKGAMAWGHGAGTKPAIMERAFGTPAGGELPEPLDMNCEGSDMVHMDFFAEYIKYLNLVKLAKPALPVTNYYDTGLLVSVLTGSVVQRGPSLLMDRDGLAMLRDAGIGHTMSKLNQLVAVQPYSRMQGVYNFFIGDGACLLNGGAELAMHLIEGYRAESMITLFVFNNHKWAIEDNLVEGAEKEHRLYNTEFYNLLERHSSVCICENDLELCETLMHLSRRTGEYLAGRAPPGISLVVVRGLEIDLPPCLGDITPIRNSPEMGFLRGVLGPFAEGCQHKVPIYGCSAFEYIQFLHIFTTEMPEGKGYQYVSGRTDIQAAHMCGFTQPDGKCVMLLNDVFGINSLGESMRLVLSGFGGKQLLVLVWHPTLLRVMDHFHLHRPPMVWPSMGPELCKYYVRKETDALFLEFQGASTVEPVTAQANAALKAGMPLVVVNMLPEQERDFVALDIRVKTV